MTKGEQPKIDLPNSDAEVWLQRITILAIAASFVLVGINYAQLPDEIPVHFDLSGHPNSWGPKIIIWVLPGIMSATAGFLLWLSTMPHNLNYPVKITPENAAFQYKKTRLVLRWLSFVTAGMTFYLSWKTIQIALGKASQLDPWFLWVFLSLIGASVIAMFIPQKKAH